MGLPAFIPADQVDPRKEYRHYVATSKGLVRKDRAGFYGWARGGETVVKDGVPIYSGGGSIGFKQPVHEGFSDWGVEPNRKRTHSERVDSLAARIWEQNTKGGGLPESVAQHALDIVKRMGREGVTEELMREIQALSLKAGKFQTFEECRRLATLYMKEAQNEWDDKNEKRVTSKSTNVLDRPSAG